MRWAACSILAALACSVLAYVVLSPSAHAVDIAVVQKKQAESFTANPQQTNVLSCPSTCEGDQALRMFANSTATQYYQPDHSWRYLQVSWRGNGHAKIVVTDLSSNSSESSKTFADQNIHKTSFGEPFTYLRFCGGDECIFPANHVYQVDIIGTSLGGDDFLVVDWLALSKPST